MNEICFCETFGHMVLTYTFGLPQAKTTIHQFKPTEIFPEKWWKVMNDKAEKCKNLKWKVRELGDYIRLLKT